MIIMYRISSSNDKDVVIRSRSLEKLYLLQLCQPRIPAGKQVQQRESGDKLRQSGKQMKNSICDPILTVKILHRGDLGGSVTRAGGIWRRFQIPFNSKCSIQICEDYIAPNPIAEDTTSHHYRPLCDRLTKMYFC